MSWFLLAIGFGINIGWHRIIKEKDDKEVYTFLAFGWALYIVYWAVMWYTRILRGLYQFLQN